MIYQLHYFDNQMNPYHIDLQNDPVRPNIPTYRRYGHNRGIFALTSDEYSFPLAMACCSFMGFVPQNEAELLEDHDRFNVAVFYTVWSERSHKRPPNTTGAGGVIINKALNHIWFMKPFVKRVVTLSPKTEMARKFHLNNGAELYRENEETMNFEYRI